MQQVSCGSVYNAAAQSTTIYTNGATWKGFIFISAVVPVGLTVETLENPAQKFLVRRGAKLPLETSRGYKFNYPQTYHGNIDGTTPYGTAALFNNAGDSSYLNGALYVVTFQDCNEYNLYEVGELLPVELALQHALQYDGAAITTNTWGFLNLDYGSVMVKCRNVNDGYSIPYVLHDRALTGDYHNVRCLGFLSACHLTAATTFANGGELRLTGVRNLRIGILGDFAYLLNSTDDTTYFYYRFDDEPQANPVVGVSRFKGYITWTTTLSKDIPAPERGYGFAHLYNISGVLATSTSLERRVAVQYNNNLQSNNDPNTMVTPASLGGGIARSTAGVSTTGCEWMTWKGTSAGTVTLLLTLDLHHQYI